MSVFEKRSLGILARILALPIAIAFLLLILVNFFATAGSCAEKGGSTGSGTTHHSSQTEKAEESDNQPEPMPPLPEEQNDDSEPVLQGKASDEIESTAVPTRTLPPPLKALSEARYLYDRSAGGSSDLTKALAQAAKDAASHKEDLEWIARNGTPAGQVYAVILIRHYDKLKGDSLLKDFKNDKDTMVDLNSLEGSYHYSLAEIATDLLSASSIIRLESDR